MHIIHIFAVFIYGGFLFTDNLFISKMKQDLDEKEYTKAREAIMVHVRKLVPYSLLVAVLAGGYMFGKAFGTVGENGMNSFQIVLSIKAFFGLWLGFRGVNQKFFGIQPWVFKSHIFPFAILILIIFLSQLMYMV